MRSRCSCAAVTGIHLVESIDFYVLFVACEILRFAARLRRATLDLVFTQAITSLVQVFRTHSLNISKIFSRMLRSGRKTGAVGCTKTKKR